MAPVTSATLRPGKPPIRRDSDRIEIVDDDTLSIRSIDTRDSYDEPEPPRRPATPPSKLEGIEEGMRCEVANQFHDRRGLAGYRTEVVAKDDEAPPTFVLHPDTEWLKQFAIQARKRPVIAAKDGFDLVCIRIRSPLLKAILGDLCKDYPGFSGQKGKSLFAMDMYDPFDGLFHCWTDLLRLEEEHANPEARAHIKLLHNLMEPHFEKPLKKLEECRLNGNITFHDLWTIFKPGDLIYRQDVHGLECVERIDDIYYGMNHERRAFKVESKMVCWDGTRFGYGLSCGWFYTFAGTMSVMDLPAVPLDIHPDRVAIKERMMKRGAKIQILASSSQLKAYTHQQGEAAYSLRKSPKAFSHKLQNGDRVIFDPKNSVGTPPYINELEPLVNDNPFDKVANNPSDRVSSPGSLRRSVDRRAATDLRKAREEWDMKRRLEERRAANESRKGREDPLSNNTAKAHGNAKSIDPLTEDQMLICAPDAPCFDLIRKEWVVVDLNDIGDVAWNDDLYEDLVWPLEEKQMLLAIATSYRQGSENLSNAVLDKRSRGTTIMVKGFYGVGKSFAVEAVAEKLHMPLYTIGVADLIRDFDDFEERLEDILERCSRWNAILLVKNLDFLFSNSLDGTTPGDVCAQLVDQLSRHSGLVLFTSTDTRSLPMLLKETFDLELGIRFPDTEERRKMWSNALSAAVPLKDRSFTTEHLDALTQYSVQGRDIQSTVNMATMLAQSTGSSLKMEHVEKVLQLKRPLSPFIEIRPAPHSNEQRWRPHIPHRRHDWFRPPHDIDQPFYDRDMHPHRSHRYHPDERVIIEPFPSSRSPSPEGGRPARKKFPHEWSAEPELPPFPSRSPSPHSWRLPRRNPRGNKNAWATSRSPSPAENRRQAKEKFPHAWDGDVPEVNSRSSTPVAPGFENPRVSPPEY